MAFGYLAPPDEAGRAAGEYALVVGAWNGNSDGSPVLTPENPVLSTDAAAPMWHGFLQEVTQSWPVRDFGRPPGIVDAEVDAWSGGTPTEFTAERVTEVFIEGTVPGPDNTKVGMQVIPNPNVAPDARENDPSRWLLWVDGCVGTPENHGFLALEGAEPGHPDWQAANLDWINRAKTGGPEHAWRTGPTTDSDELHLQPRVHAVRAVVGRTVCADRDLPVGALAFAVGPADVQPERDPKRRDHATAGDADADSCSGDTDTHAGSRNTHTYAAGDTDAHS